MEKRSISAWIQYDRSGVLEAGAPADPHILIHVGTSTYIECERGGQVHRGMSVHGDIDIVPAGTASRWVLKKADQGLVVRIPQNLLNAVAEDSRIDPGKTNLLNRFQIRDARIEHLGWAIKNEIDDEYKSGKLFLDSIGTALASRLLHSHSTSGQKAATGVSWGMSGIRLRRVLSFIEDNLSKDLSLSEIAHVARLSVSHCQRAFRIAVGQSIHQYVIERRVKRAEQLLSGGKLSIPEIALEVGFSHASHLSLHMRRRLGVSPGSLRGTAEYSKDSDFKRAS
jgi:AraC family transcriptional regulator